MKFSVFIGLVSFSLLTLTLQSCQKKTSPIDEDSITPTYQLKLSVETGEILPPLKTQSLETLKTEAQDLARSWLGLAGLNKAIIPSPPSESLQSFRESWKVIDANIAPFLGLWHDDGSGSNIHPYFVAIFPNRTLGKVCILEYRPQWKVLSDVILEEIFSLSTAKVVGGQLRGNRLRSSSEVIFQEEFFTGDKIEFLGIMNNQNQVQVFAAKSIPNLANFPPDFTSNTLPDISIDFTPELIEEVSQELKAQGCETSTN